ncbi:MAG TPA: lysine--tRNA ligase, partial [Dehalococcoidia bacterium]|nr:lysine--tRNA ligase [Dehalococcoidia bacterium]
LYLRRDHLGDNAYATIKDLDAGDFVEATGPLVRTKTGEVSIDVERLAPLAKALRPLPEKWHGLQDVEKRYRQRELDLISNPEVREIFRVRSRTISAIRRFMEDRGYLEVETPILLPQAGGAAARPFVTHHNALDRDLYLRIATELHLKRLIIGGFDRVYEIGRIFRNEGISTKHNPEFTTMESYEAYADYHTIMRLVEELISHVAREVLGTTTIAIDGEEVSLEPPWPRLTLRDAVREASGIDFEDYPDADDLRRVMRDRGLAVTDTLGRGKLIDELLSTYVEPKIVAPCFLTDYPIELSPLAKKRTDSPRLVERFEGFLGGMEIANAFSELNDPVDQLERFEEQARQRALGDEEADIADDDFLTALEHGMPPTGGLGVGIDRIVMALTGQRSIREVILFPQLRSRD